MTPETLTTRQLNRALLARQHLLERSPRSLTDVIEDVGGLQTQYSPSAYVGLWSRKAEFDRRELTAAMERRAVVHGTLMRVTIHTVTAGDYWPMAIAVREPRRGWVRRVAGAQLDDLDMNSMADAVRDILSVGPLKLRDLTQGLVERGFPHQAVGWVGLWVDLLRVPPSGTWDRRANDIYALAETWIPPRELHPDGIPSEEDGLRLLLQRYLHGFGPARPADFADWTGIPTRLVLPVVDAAELRRFRDEAGRELIDLPDAPLPPADTPAPVRFIAPFDPTLLTNCRRTQILPDELRPVIFPRAVSWTIGVFLVDGRVAGTWRFEAGKVTTRSLVELPAQSQREVEAEAAALADFAA